MDDISQGQPNYDLCYAADRIVNPAMVWLNAMRAARRMNTQYPAAPYLVFMTSSSVRRERKMCFD
ncbi:hypothetical protein [Tateyamaria omphalii]|uniref:hypothetical protein n=1 Tax=Tateyamaria omphalii TaxID=299262 RepID=UPI0016719C0D|nr:hypothetical protein [Tateyamaria omphalii]